MFDFLSPFTDFFGTVAQWLGYGLIATFAVGSLFILVAIPVMVKMTAVAVARTAIIETAKLLGESGIANSFVNATNSVTSAANALTKELQTQKKNFSVISLDKEKVK